MEHGPAYVCLLHLNFERADVNGVALGYFAG